MFRQTGSDLEEDDDLIASLSMAKITGDKTISSEKEAEPQFGCDSYRKLLLLLACRAE